MLEEKKVNFGFQVVDENVKQNKVQEVFSDVAEKYDLMNDLMSLGLHRYWKKYLVSQISPARQDILLDIAGGTGDIAEQFLAKGGKEASICDLNEQMLQRGKERRIDRGLLNLPLKLVCANAESLPFSDNSFDFCTISFGIRNVTHISKALSEARRVLKPGGKFLCLEFSHVNNIMLRRFYDFYSFQVIPKIGAYIAGSADHYRYLSESIRLFPEAEEFANMLREVRFDFVKYQKLSCGIVALHTAFKT